MIAITVTLFYMVLINSYNAEFKLSLLVVAYIEHSFYTMFNNLIQITVLLNLCNEKFTHF